MGGAGRRDDRHRRVRPLPGQVRDHRAAGGGRPRYTYGLAGVGPRLPLLLSAAAARGLPIERVARLAAENPARAFGHYPAKGALAPGSDADIVIFDPDGDAVLPDDGFGDGTGDSVYAGLAARGRIRAVLLRGQLIVSDGVLTDDRRPGRYLPAAGAAA